MHDLIWREHDAYVRHWLTKVYNIIRFTNMCIQVFIVPVKQTLLGLYKAGRYFFLSSVQPQFIQNFIKYVV